MTVNFTSDLHFNHRSIIDYCSRPWATVPDMNEGLIERWNAVVRPKDTTWVLGDFGFNGGSYEGYDLLGIFLRLHGKKNLVIGNHDEKNPKVLKLPWDLITPMATVRGENKMRAVACHYPMETWKYPERYIMLHGHSHGTLQTVKPRRFDVGVDVPDWGYGPIAFETLWELAAGQAYDPCDHHGA